MYPFSLREILKKHRTTLVGVVLLSIIESGLFVAQFYFIGKAVNELLKDSWTGIYILIGLFVTKLIVSAIKQSRIGKTYKTLYDQLISDAVAQPLAAGERLENLASKSTFIYMLTDFIKTDLIKGFETGIRLFFVLISLFLMNKMIFGVALALLMIVFVLYFIRRKTTIELSKDIADELVLEHQILNSKNVERLFGHHEKLEKLDNRLLGISGVNLAIIEILAFAFLLVSMIILVKTDAENALGTFFSMLYYVTAFSEILFLLPSIYQKYLRMEEVSKKI